MALATEPGRALNDETCIGKARAHGPGSAIGRRGTSGPGVKRDLTQEMWRPKLRILRRGESVEKPSVRRVIPARQSLAGISQDDLQVQIAGQEFPCTRFQDSHEGRGQTGNLWK